MDIHTPYPLHLHIGEVIRYPYVNHSFPVEIFLLDEKAQLKTNIDISITAKLYYDEKPIRECDESILVIDNPTLLCIGKTGTTTIHLRLTDVSMNHDNKRFIILFSGESPHGGSINPVLTPGMLSVRHRLVLGDMKQFAVWYKDEGGREKSIDMSVTLLDHNQEKVTDRRIQLKLTLLYENGQDVPKQDILRLDNESRLFIDENTGETCLRFRIDEVSRSHQRQLFRVLVSPDSAHYPLTSDISPDQTIPIEVRSKRNKKDKGGGGGTSQDTSDISDKRQRLDYSDSSVGNAGQYSSGSVLSEQDDHRQTTTTTAFPFPTRSLSETNIGGGSSSGTGTGMRNRTTQSSSLQDFRTISSSSPKPSVSSSAAETGVSDLISWTTLVMRSLQDMHWQCVGYNETIQRSLDILTKEFCSDDNGLSASFATTDRSWECSDLNHSSVSASTPGGGNGDADSLFAQLRAVAVHPYFREDLTSFISTTGTFTDTNQDISYDGTAGSSLSRPSLSRESHRQTIADILNVSNFMNGTDSDVERLDVNNDQDVFYVLVDPVQFASHRKDYFAAFDDQQNLLGFYSEDKDGNGVTIRFQRVCDFFGLTDEQIDPLIDQLQSGLRSSSQNQFVHSLSEYECLSKMREEVFFHQWNILRYIILQLANNPQYDSPSFFPLVTSRIIGKVLKDLIFTLPTISHHISPAHTATSVISSKSLLRHTQLGSKGYDYPRGNTHALLPEPHLSAHSSTSPSALPTYPDYPRPPSSTKDIRPIILVPVARRYLTDTINFPYHGGEMIDPKCVSRTDSPSTPII
eukprot:gene1517-2917_t